MIKKLIFIISFLFITSYSFAEKVYVYIEKIGYVEKGQEAGHTELGDIVGIYPATSQYKPTKAELDNYFVVVMDLTLDEQRKLIKGLEVPTGEIDFDGSPVIKIIKARKYKLKLDNMKTLKQGQEIDKKIIIDNIIIKPIQ